MKKICLFLVSISLLVADDPMLIDVDVYINDERVGPCDLVLNPADESLTFIPFAITQVVSSTLSEEGKEELFSFLSQYSKIKSGKAHKSDLFSIEMSDIDQSLRIKVDPMLISLKKQEVGKKSSHQYKRHAAQEISASRQSGYLNVLFGEKFNKTTYPAFTYAKREETGNFDGVINYRDWVLQGFAYYVSKGVSKINRGNVLLTHDFPANNLRFSMGDINTLGIGYQNSVPLAGISLHKNIRLFTDSTIGPVSRHEIFLNVPSTVEVFVDGITITTLQLRAGPHLLENFPIVDGMNDVVLKITSPTGEVRTIDLGYFYNAQILSSGESEYFLSAGFPTFDNGFQKYGAFPTYSANYLYGLSNNTNVGVYLQGQQKKVYFGGETSYTNPYFNLLCDLGGSYVNSLEGKARMLISKSNKSRSFFSWKGAVEYTDRDFAYLGSRATTNPRKVTYSGSIILSILRNASLSFVGEYLNYRTENNTYYTQAIFSSYFRKALSVKLIGRYEKLVTGKFEKSLAFNIDFMPKIKDITFRNDYNSRSKSFSSDVSYQHRLSENRSVAAAIGYQQREGTQTAKGSFNYDGNHGSLNVSHYLAQLSVIDPKSTIAVTQATIGTSIVYADNTFAISRPIKDSFVIIAPNKHLKHQALLINPSPKGGYAAKASYLMPAVLPLTSYRSSIIQVAHDGDMIGQTFENETIEIKPTYKSGSLIKLGDPPTYIVEGKLLDMEGRPISSKGGLLIDYKNEKRPCYSFFTDEKGKFQLIGVPEGEYEVKVLPNQEEIPKIKICGDLLCDVGVIFLKGSEKND